MADAAADLFEDRVVALETRISYQDDAVETLNAMVTAQWSAIEKLTREISDIRDQLSQTGSPAPAGLAEETPPHY